MMKLPLIIGNGMASVFCTTLVVQHLVVGETTPVFAGDGAHWFSMDKAIEILREFGFPTLIAIVTGLFCKFLVLRWYRDIMRQIAELKQENRELRLENRELAVKVAFYEGKEASAGKNEATK